ncbi:hypothetical protein HII31_11887 [Pseudocercospora fuligena]|uniref:Uncharacterized protein n=1 Tax=Pseudocercospora fuligena TaxID=685502 RepID=A0A8H6VD17_9PEZI|nr:hypothetical protein HII31_11887 [Pseudocercospora fuligena]
MSSSARNCYFPDGNIAPYATPCNASAEVSHCFQENDACVSNGYCFQQGTDPGTWNNRMARGSCTDQTFNDSRCPQHCKDDFSEGNMPLWMPDSQVNFSMFCCYSNDYDIETNTCGKTDLGSRQPFELAPGQFIYNRDLGLTDPVSAAETLTRTVLVTVSPTSNATISAARNSNSSAKIAAISTGAVLGTLLFASILAIILLTSRLKGLRKAHDEAKKDLQASRAIQDTQMSQAQKHGDTEHIHEISSHTQRVEFPAGEDPVEIEARPPELSAYDQH